MNLLEREMLSLLRQGYECYGFTHVRAEFESEGTRIDELLRLVELGYKAGLTLLIKIGGGESVSDLYKAKQLGASAIIAPMIESTYGLQKYGKACQKVFPPTQGYDTDFYFNIETSQAYHHHEELIAASCLLGVKGVVFGRVDFTASLGLPRDDINTPLITEKMITVAKVCQKHTQDFIIGGGISVESIPVLKTLDPIHLTRFETRKIAFDRSQVSQETIESALLAAARFEFLWLQNKQEYYCNLQKEDKDRIKLLEKRLSCPI